MRERRHRLGVRITYDDQIRHARPEQIDDERRAHWRDADSPNASFTTPCTTPTRTPTPRARARRGYTRRVGGDEDDDSARDGSEFTHRKRRRGTPRRWRSWRRRRRAQDVPFSNDVTVGLADERRMTQRRHRAREEVVHRGSVGARIVFVLHCVSRTRISRRLTIRRASFRSRSVAVIARRERFARE